MHFAKNLFYERLINVMDSPGLLFLFQIRFKTFLLLIIFPISVATGVDTSCKYSVC